ncbi:MAG: HemK2/MTQ2 family protein methyltransferase [Methanoregula sp.]
MSHDPSQVYQPEADTYLLLDAAIIEVKPGDRVLEIGTGSGLISRELSKVSDVVATDINPHATLCARGPGVQVVRSNLFAGIRGTFDLIIFNPPYLPTQPEERIDDWLEYALDGGTTGRDVIERFSVGVDPVLAPGGRILLLISSLTGLDEVSDLFLKHGFVTRVMVAQLIEDEELYVLYIARVPPAFS